MTDKEIEAGIERACECGCAPPSTGWTVNPFPIIRDYIERLKHRAEVAEKALRKAVSVLDAEYRAFGVNKENKTEQRIKNFIAQAENELAEEI